MWISHVALYGGPAHQEPGYEARVVCYYSTGVMIARCGSEGSFCSVAAVQLITLVRVAPVERLGGNYYIICTNELYLETHDLMVVYNHQNDILLMYDNTL